MKFYFKYLCAKAFFILLLFKINNIRHITLNTFKGFLNWSKIIIFPKLFAFGLYFRTQTPFCFFNVLRRNLLVNYYDQIVSIYYLLSLCFMKCLPSRCIECLIINRLIIVEDLTNSFFRTANGAARISRAINLYLWRRRLKYAGLLIIN